MEEISMGYNKKNILEEVEEFVEEHATTICVATLVMTYAVAALSNVLTNKALVKQDKEYNDKLIMIRALQN